MKYPNLSQSHFVTNKVYVNHDVLGALMLNRVVGQVDDTNIVIINKGASERRIKELTQEIVEPISLSNNISHVAILSFGTGSRNRTLSFGRPGEKVGAKKNTIPRSGAASGRAANPVSFKICDQPSRMGCI